MGENPDFATESGQTDKAGLLRQLQNESFLLERYLLDLERSYVGIALEHCNGNLSQAAKLLKMNRTTLYSRLDKLGLK